MTAAMKDPLDSLRGLPEMEPPAALDALVLDRSLSILGSDARKAEPVVAPVSRVESLAYAAGVAVYFAQAMHVAVRLILRGLS